MESRDHVQSTPGTSGRGQGPQSGKTAQDDRVSRSRTPSSRAGRKSPRDGSAGSSGTRARSPNSGERSVRRGRSSRRDRSLRPESVDAYGASKPRRPREGVSGSPSRRPSLNPFRGLIPHEGPRDSRRRERRRARSPTPRSPHSRGGHEERVAERRSRSPRTFYSPQAESSAERRRERRRQGSKRRHSSRCSRSPFRSPSPRRSRRTRRPRALSHSPSSEEGESPNDRRHRSRGRRVKSTSDRVLEELSRTNRELMRQLKAQGEAMTTMLQRKAVAREQSEEPQSQQGAEAASSGAARATYEKGEAHKIRSDLLSEEAASEGSFLLIPGDPLPEQLLAKIRADEYVDLRDLLKKGPRTYEPVGAVEGGHLEVEGAERKMVWVEQPKGPLTMTQWSQAFDIYAEAFASVFPSAAPDLRRYDKFVRGLMKLGGGTWLQYDEAFRRKRTALKLPFCYFDQASLLQAQLQQHTKRAALPGPAPSGVGSYATRGGKSSQKNMATCYAFNRGVSCLRLPNCSFRHVCSTCDGPHPGKECTEAGRKRSTVPGRGGRGGGKRTAVADRLE